jgi:hypothetical protein
LEKKPKWFVGAKLFSGRPDPVWAISRGTAGKLLRLWGQLAPYRGAKPIPPVLGYRGCFVEEHLSNRRWEAYGGVVSLGAETRYDPDRSFEEALLNTAPPGLGISASALLRTGG